jgi:hypothetical protein
MTYTITLRSFDGHKETVYVGDSLDEAVGYMCAITSAQVERRNVRHCMTHPSYRVKTFTASGLDGSMYELRQM